MHIGANELKTLAWAHLKPHWDGYARGFTVRLEDLVLRNQKWAKIAPPVHGVDRDAIASDFYKEKKQGAGLKFDPGKGAQIYLHLPPPLCRALEDHLTMLESLELERRARAHEAHLHSGTEREHQRGSHLPVRSVVPWRDDSTSV